MEAAAEQNPATVTLAVFDHYWFRHLILRKLPLPPPPPSPPPPPPPPPVGLIQRRHRRSLSDELYHIPTLRLEAPKLQTILSGKEPAMGDETAEVEESKSSERRLSRMGKKRNKSSKSLSDLEFEELKGFMDLGFTFSEVDPDSRLMSIVPGLQRLKAAELETENCGSDAGGDGEDEVVVLRPYLSEVWQAAEEEKLRDFRIPVIGEGVDVKDQLRFWAHAVANTVR